MVYSPLFLITAAQQLIAANGSPSSRNYPWALPQAPAQTAYSTPNYNFGSLWSNPFAATSNYQTRFDPTPYITPGAQRYAPYGYPLNPTTNAYGFPFSGVSGYGYRSPYLDPSQANPFANPFAYGMLYS